MLTQSKSPIEQAHKRILLVDDNREIHRDYRKILGESAENTGELDAMESMLLGDAYEAKETNYFDLESAYQGEEAVDMVRLSLEEGRPYALAFMDVRMPPGIDGIQTTIKIWEIDPDIQVVLCTAYSDYSWDEILSETGKSDKLVILKKPFDNIEVLQLANSLTEKWRLLQESKLRIEQLEEESILAAHELRRVEDQYRLIAEHASDFITVLDRQGRVEYSSPSVSRLFNYSPEELQNGLLVNFIHPEDQKHFIDVIEQAFSEGKVGLAEYRFLHKDGSWKVLESQASLIPEKESQSEQLVIFARDVTSRKELEIERAGMEIKLRHAQKMESIGQLAAGIAHEINTPTQYIGDNTRFLKDGFADFSKLVLRYREILENVAGDNDNKEWERLAEGAEGEVDWPYLSEEVPNAINQTLDGVKQVARIVKAMKEFSHPGSEGQSQVDLNQAIESTVTVARNEWKYVAELELDLDPDLPPVSCFPGEFNQAILNLITNAAHAIGDDPKRDKESKGSIHISTRALPDGTEIRIVDTGPGIPDQLKEKVFEPFFTTKVVGKGTGQGLAIVHTVIVKKHGGRIDLNSEPGKGTTFTIWLPKEIPNEPQASSAK